MAGFFGPHITKQMWADVELKSGGSLHARLFGSFSRQLVEDVLAELPPLTASDVIVVNFGAWYPRFERQVHQKSIRLTVQLRSECGSGPQSRRTLKEGTAWWSRRMAACDRAHLLWSAASSTATSGTWRSC